MPAQFKDRSDEKSPMKELRLSHNQLEIFSLCINSPGAPMTLTERETEEAIVLLAKIAQGSLSLLIDAGVLTEDEDLFQTLNDLKRNHRPDA